MAIFTNVFKVHISIKCTMRYSIRKFSRGIVHRHLNSSKNIFSRVDFLKKNNTTDFSGGKILKLRMCFLKPISFKTPTLHFYVMGGTIEPKLKCLLLFSLSFPLRNQKCKANTFSSWYSMLLQFHALAGQPAALSVSKNGFI